MAPRYWGEILLPEQRGPFIEQTISSLHSLATRVAQHNLEPIRLTHWSCVTRVRVDGRMASQVLRIKTSGKLVLEETWGFFRKGARTRFINDEELAELLEKQMIGLGDIQDIQTRVDIILALRELMTLPQVQRLLRSVVIYEDSGQSITTYILLTSRGIEYRGVSGSDCVTITDPSKIDLAFVNRRRLLTLNDVKKAKAKLELAQN